MVRVQSNGVLPARQFAPRQLEPGGGWTSSLSSRRRLPNIYEDQLAITAQKETTQLLWLPITRPLQAQH